jgi:hypothetical protein
MTDAEVLRNAAAELRRLADLIERDPPAKVDVSYRRRSPFEVTGVDLMDAEDGYERVQVEVHW